MFSENASVSQNAKLVSSDVWFVFIFMSSSYESMVLLIYTEIMLFTQLNIYNIFLIKWKTKNKNTTLSMFINKMKNEEYHAVRIVPKSNRKKH